MSEEGRRGEAEQFDEPHSICPIPWSRSPIFIPLDLSPLTIGPGKRKASSVGIGDLFIEYPEDTRLLRLQLFQAEILKRFGFLEDPTKPTATPHFEGQ